MSNPSHTPESYKASLSAAADEARKIVEAGQAINVACRIEGAPIGELREEVRRYLEAIDKASTAIHNHMPPIRGGQSCH